MANPISEIVLGEVIADESVLLDRGFIFIDDEKQNMVSNRIPELLEANGITEADLAAITGLTRQNLNMIIQSRIKPSVDFALKAAELFKVPVQSIFSLKEGAWFDKISGFKDSAIFLQTNINKVIGKSERDANMKENQAEFWETETGRLLTKEEHQDLLRDFLLEHQENLMNQLGAINPNLTRNEKLSAAHQQLKEEFALKHPKLYKKIGQKINPEEMLVECKIRRSKKNQKK